MYLCVSKHRTRKGEFGSDNFGMVFCIRTFGSPALGAVVDDATSICYAMLLVGFIYHTQGIRPRCYCHLCFMLFDKFMFLD